MEPILRRSRIDDAPAEQAGLACYKRKRFDTAFTEGSDMRITRSITPAVALIAACSGAVAAVRDNAYPTRPIRLIVPYPPGSGTDFTGRELGAQFSKALGQPVVIDNRPGGAATLVRNDLESWKKLIKAAKISVDVLP